MKLIVRVCVIALMSMTCIAFMGCTSNDQTSSAASTEPASEEATSVIIGTMPTEDILPMWVAEADGIFAEYGVDAEVVSFDSAQSLSAALVAGEVDMAMTDIMRSVRLSETGSPVELEWVTLGTEAAQGRFGVLAPADAPYTNLEELAAYLASDEGASSAGVGVAANTVPEYVFDMLCEEAGVDPTTIATEEVASLPERYSLTVNGQLAASALPASLLELGQANGLVLLADDTQGENISQSVMVARQEFAEEHPEAILAVAYAWDDAVAAIEVDPESYRALLVEKANLNQTIADTYPISSYPVAVEGVELVRPLSSMVMPQLVWMQEKGYSEGAVAYDEETGRFVID